MNRLTSFLFAALAVTLWSQSAPGAPGLLPRTESASRQFIVYSQDAAVRGQVASFADEQRRLALELLGESPADKHTPILITVEQAPPGINSQPPVDLLVSETPDGTRIELRVVIGNDPAAIHLQKHIIRAVLLEYIYRKEGIRGGERWIEPPWWIVEAIIERARQQDRGVDAEAFRSIISREKLPSLAQFLAAPAPQLGVASQRFDSACAMALVELLIDQPVGKATLGQFLREWPKNHSDPVGSLMRRFPSLGKTPEDLQKWWALNLARLSAADRYKGLSVVETEQELAALLEFQIEVGKEKEKRQFTIAEFSEFVKLPEAKPVLKQRQSALVALGARANPVFRPIVNEYEQIFSALVRGKTRGLVKRIVAIERYRDSLLHRMTAINDYMNWYQATQMGQRSNSFDAYLRAAKEAEAAATPKPEQAIVEYLDELEKVLDPELEDAIGGP